jgi:hypothetical protein
MEYTYELTKWTVILRSDGVCIPLDGNNIDYQAYQTWLAAGNTPTPAQVEVVPLAQQAKTAISATDTTMLRIADAVAVGKTTWTTTDVAAWAAYRRALRAIVNGTDMTSTVLPVAPAYPANT